VRPSVLCDVISAVAELMVRLKLGGWTGEAFSVV
jgi:hypothetical protein